MASMTLPSQGAPRTAYGPSQQNRGSLTRTPVPVSRAVVTLRCQSGNGRLPSFPVAMPKKNPGGPGAKPPLPLSHRKPALSSHFTMAAWKSAPFPYDLILEIPYDVNLENNIYDSRSTNLVNKALHKTLTLHAPLTPRQLHHPQRILFGP